MIASSPAVRPSAKPPARRKPGRRSLLTPAEVAEITRRYQSETAANIAASLGRHLTTIENCLKRLGIRKGLGRRGNMSHLSDSEVAYIRTHYSSVPTVAIADHLGRNWRTVVRYARRLGLEPPSTYRGPRKIGYIEPRYADERGVISEETTAEIRRLCHEAGIATHEPDTLTGYPVPTKILARRLVRATDWRPANCFVAADLGLEDWFTPRPAATPTSTQPGTPERVAVYMARVEAGEEIWHPRDGNP